MKVSMKNLAYILLKKAICLLIWIVIYYFVFRGTMFLLSNTVERILESELWLNMIAFAFIFIVNTTITSLLTYKVNDIIPWLRTELD